MKRAIVFFVLFLMSSVTVYGSDMTDIESIEIGANKKEVYDKIGMGESSSEGLKEIYTLPGGEKLIFHYNDDVLIRGYIIDQVV